MGSEFVRVEIIGRAKGHSAIKAAAYRSGTRLYDSRLGVTCDYSARSSEIAHSDILIPTGAPEFLRDRETLWLAIESAEDRSTRRATAQLAKDHLLALPREFTLAQQVELVRDFALEAFVAQGLAADYSVYQHKPDNPHAHLMCTTRLIGAEGIGKKARHLNGAFWKGQRLPADEQVRHAWANFQNRWAFERELDLCVTNNNGEWEAEPHRGATQHMILKDGECTDIGTLADQRAVWRVEAITADPQLLIRRVSQAKPNWTLNDVLGELARHVPTGEVRDRIAEKLKGLITGQG